jgi:quercetin dioxygenase-like cupin family protein
LDPATNIPEGGDYKMIVVSFGKGVRNKFHTHESDQILVVTEGKGIVSTEGVKKEVTAGDVILFPAGETYWHGASDDSTFSQIAISRAESKTTQVED